MWDLAPLSGRAAPAQKAQAARAPPRVRAPRRPAAPGRDAEEPRDARHHVWLVALLAFACAAGGVTALGLWLRADAPSKTAVKRAAPKPLLVPRPREERPEQGDFYTPRGLKQLYGNYDPNLDGAFWTVTGAPAAYTRWNGKQVFVRPLVSRPFGEAERARQILVTNTLEVKDGMIVKQGTGCRRCVSLIGAAIFEKAGDRWTVISRNDFVVADGAFGAPPRVSVEFPTAGAIELRFEKFSTEEGDSATRRYSVVIKERSSGSR